MYGYDINALWEAIWAINCCIKGLHIAMGLATETPPPIDDDGGINMGIIMILTCGENIRKGRNRNLRGKAIHVDRQ